MGGLVDIHAEGVGECGHGGVECDEVGDEDAVVEVVEVGGVGVGGGEQVGGGGV